MRATIWICRRLGEVMQSNTRILSRVRAYVGQPLVGLSSFEIRDRFIKFYKTHDHQFIPSSAVRISSDDSLMFVNAGMNQFKPKFLGINDPNDRLERVKRAVNSQKCIRVGGKHNDLDDVGKDTTHHTFFEMLGSWSFGCYFKKEACEMSLDLLTQHFGLPVDKLYFTYFAGNAHVPADTMTRDTWRSLGVPENKIIPFGVEDNFWEMGNTGPCGPCTEIHYNFSNVCRNVSDLVNRGHPDVVEIWNLVFMQFNRLYDGSLVKLPTHHVDTGMGLERLAAILQGKHSNYDTDLFLPLIKEIEDVCTDCPRYTGGHSSIDQAYRTVADHARMLVISAGDKIYPGNTNQELIVRQVLRRAYLRSKLHLKAPDNLLKLLCPLVISSLGNHFESLQKDKDLIIDVIDHDVMSFVETLSKGEQIFNSTLLRMEGKTFPVETALLMHNHYGYPLELLKVDIRREQLEFDAKKFERYQELRKQSKMTTAKQESTKKIEITSNVLQSLKTTGVPVTNFEAKYDYGRLENGNYIFPSLQTELLAVIDEDGVIVTEMQIDKYYALVFRDTCFYHTDGGQISDTGTISSDHGNFKVTEVSSYGGLIIHFGSGADFKVGDNVSMHIDCDRRLGCMRAHTATHLLNHAIREVIGNISQNGSLVSQDELRFTFLGPTPTHKNLQDIMSLIRQNIAANLLVKDRRKLLEVASNDRNIRKLDDMIYTDSVRIVSIGSSTQNNHSVELCGGTHVLQTFDIGDFEMTSSKSQGKHKTTVRCFTASKAKESIKRLLKLKSQVEVNLRKASNILASPSATIDEIFTVKREIGRTNSEVNHAVISVIAKAELKEKLRKHSQMLSTKIRKIRIDSFRNDSTKV